MAKSSFIGWWRRNWEPATALGTVTTAVASVFVSVWALIASLNGLEANRETIRLAKDGVELSRSAQKSSEINALIERLPALSIGTRPHLGEIVVMNQGLGPAHLYQLTLIGPKTESDIDTNMNFTAQKAAYQSFFKTNYPELYDHIKGTEVAQSTGAIGVGDAVQLFKFSVASDADYQMIRGMLDQTTILFCFADLTASYFTGGVSGDFTKAKGRKCYQPEPMLNLAELNNHNARQNRAEERPQQPID